MTVEPTSFRCRATTGTVVLAPRANPFSPCIGACWIRGGTCRGSAGNRAGVAWTTTLDMKRAGLVLPIGYGHVLCSRGADEWLSCGHAGRGGLDAVLAHGHESSGLSATGHEPYPHLS